MFRRTDPLEAISQAFAEAVAEGDLEAAQGWFAAAQARVARTGCRHDGGSERLGCLACSRLDELAAGAR